MAMDRRKFCRLAGLSVFGVAGAAARPARSEAPDAERSTATEIADPILGKRWAMVVDLAACRKEEGCRDSVSYTHLRAHET